MTAPVFRGVRNSTSLSGLLYPGGTNPGDLLFWVLCGGSTSTVPAGWTFVILEEGGTANANILAALFRVARPGESACPDPSVFMPGMKAQAVLNYGAAQVWDWNVADGAENYGTSSDLHVASPTSGLVYGPTTYNPGAFGHGFPPSDYTVLSFGYAHPTSGTETTAGGYPGSGFTNRLFTQVNDGVTAFFFADAVQTGGTDFAGRTTPSFVSPTSDAWCTVSVGLVSVAGTGMGMVV